MRAQQPFALVEELCVDVEQHARADLVSDFDEPIGTEEGDAELGAHVAEEEVRIANVGADDLLDECVELALSADTHRREQQPLLKRWVAPIEALPTTEPPKSDLWAIEQLKPTRTPSQKAGTATARSGVCGMPASYGWLVKKMSPGTRSS